MFSGLLPKVTNFFGGLFNRSTTPSVPTWSQLNMPPVNPTPISPAIHTVRIPSTTTTPTTMVPSLGQSVNPMQTIPAPLGSANHTNQLLDGNFFNQTTGASVSQMPTVQTPTAPVPPQFQLPPQLANIGLTGQQLGLAPTQSQQQYIDYSTGTGQGKDQGALGRLLSLQNQLAQAKAPTAEQAKIQAMIDETQQRLSETNPYDIGRQQINNPNYAGLTTSELNAQVVAQQEPITATLSHLLTSRSALGTLQAQRVAGLQAQTQQEQNAQQMQQSIAALRNQYQVLPEGVRSAILERYLAPQITPHFENTGGGIFNFPTNQFGQIVGKQYAAPSPLNMFNFNPFGGGFGGNQSQGQIQQFNPNSPLDIQAQTYMQTGQLPSAAQRNPLIGSQIQQRANQLAGGTFNPTVAQGQAAAVKDLTDQKAQVVAAFGAADRNFPMLLDVVKRAGVNDFDMPLANQLQQAVNNRFIGSGDMASFNTLVTSLQTEYSRILARGGQVSDKTRGEAEALINGKLGYNGLKDLYETLKKEATNVLAGYDEAIKQNSFSVGQSQGNQGGQYQAGTIRIMKDINGLATPYIRDNQGNWNPQ